MFVLHETGERGDRKGETLYSDHRGSAAVV